MDSISARAVTRVRAAPVEVFNAFVDAEKMSKFWFTRRDEGLREGETMFWFVGEAKDAFAFEVRVMEIKKPELIRIDWKINEHYNKVRWLIQEAKDGYSNLTIEES